MNEGNSGPVYYTAAEILAGLNEAQRFFVLLTLGLEKTVQVTWPAATPFQHMLPVLPDLIVTLRVANATGGKIRPSRLEDIGALDGNWLNRPGTITRYTAVGADLVGVYAQPTEVCTLNWTYARAPVPLVDPTDVQEIPEEYAPRLVDYAIYRVRQVEGAQELEKSLKYFGSFLDGATHYGKYVRSRNLGSRYDKVPFELEGYDRSKLLRLRTDLYPARRMRDQT